MGVISKNMFFREVAIILVLALFLALKSMRDLREGSQIARKNAREKLKGSIVIFKKSRTVRFYRRKGLPHSS